MVQVVSVTSHSQDIDAARKILRTVFGYEDFRGAQAEVISEIIAGRSALVLMPTGGGKSLCYQIPALLRAGVGVVISPLIALMQDQVDALRAAGVRAGFINSTLSSDDYQTVMRALRRGELDLWYLAPERLSQAGTLEMLVGGNWQVMQYTVVLKILLGIILVQVLLWQQRVRYTQRISI
jgi:ATP-dependent DNA helicase RecQ